MEWTIEDSNIGRLEFIYQNVSWRKVVSLVSTKFRNPKDRKTYHTQKSHVRRGQSRLSVAGTNCNNGHRGERQTTLQFDTHDPAWPRYHISPIRELFHDHCILHPGQGSQRQSLMPRWRWHLPNFLFTLKFSVSQKCLICSHFLYDWHLLREKKTFKENSGDC